MFYRIRAPSSKGVFGLTKCNFIKKGNQLKIFFLKYHDVLLSFHNRSGRGDYHRYIYLGTFQTRIKDVFPI